jgi:2-polyprenyl-3-methyl-5-hydroxy-6-metoxy-1,4-benzoquinol methylase
MSTRLENEKAHGRAIAGQAEVVWNWAGPAGLRRWERRVRFILDRLPPGAQVLEVGCGTGLLTAALAAAGRSLCAIDISLELLRRARQRLADAAGGEGALLSVQNAYATGLRAGAFDAVVGISVLHHLELDAALAEFRRLLRPGGALLFSEPNMVNPIILLQKNVPALKRRAGDSPDETAFVRGPLARRLAAAGFQGIRVEPFDFLHPATPAAAVGAVDRLSRALERVPLVRELGGSLLIEARAPVGAEAR